MENLLLWDFDGVVVDSLNECLLTSYNAFVSYKDKGEGLALDIKDVPKIYSEGFFLMRKYVRRAGQYLVIYEAISNNLQVRNYASFEKILKTLKKDLEQYEDLFYTVRDKFRSLGIDEWLSLNRVYPHVKTKWQYLNSSFEFFVVSNKDAKSIELILKNEGLCIRKENVYGKEFGPDKTKIIRIILDKMKPDPQNVFFIDDNYMHLLDAKDLNIRLFFANWGYGQKVQEPLEGVTILEPDNFDVELKRINDGKICKGSLQK